MAEPLHQFPASPEQTFLRDICISYEKVDENICKIFQYLSGIFALIRQLLQLTTQWQNNKLRGKPNKRFCFKGFNDSFCNLSYSSERNSTYCGFSDFSQCNQRLLSAFGCPYGCSRMDGFRARKYIRLHAKITVMIFYHKTGLQSGFSRLVYCKLFLSES